MLRLFAAGGLVQKSITNVRRGMKKIAKFLSAIVLLLGMSVAGVSAEKIVCTISNSAPNSVTVCEFDIDQETFYECTNEGLIEVDNEQVAQSGGAVVTGNTGGGGASSGDALNVGEFTIDADLDCGEDEPEEPQEPEEPAAPTTPETPAEGQGAATEEVAELPETGQTSPAMIAFAVLAGAGLLGIAAQTVIARSQR